ncbi:hypothetical protein ACH5RR_039328 [Cinchona calisaya]|uniref:Uncharacterized protein n=1 Tax=Cinchona calisaya TaxID=153742 RepID=A0ABD2Y206_9GENT
MVENGLGVRNFSTIIDYFYLKMWWNFHNSTSLWANFMRARYGFGSLSNPSRVWRQMMSDKHVVDLHFQKQIYSGKSLFWFDNWLGNGIFVDKVDQIELPDFPINSLFSNMQGRNLPPMQHVFPSNIRSKILDFQVLFTSGRDRIIWNLTSSGVFTTSSAYESLRMKRHKLMS